MQEERINMVNNELLYILHKIIQEGELLTVGVLVLLPVSVLAYYKGQHNYA